MGKLDGTIALITGGTSGIGVRGDVSNLADLERLFAQIARDKGRLDVVFANAGIAKYASLDTITRSSSRRSST